MKTDGTETDNIEEMGGFPWQPPAASESVLNDLLYSDLVNLMRRCANHNAPKKMKEIYGLLERLHDALFTGRI